MVLLLASSSEAAVYVAPFKGNYSTFGYSQSTRCSVARVLHASTFSLRTGIGSWAGSGDSRTPCGNGFGGVGGASSSDLQGGVQFALPVVPTTAGATNITVGWTIRAALTDAMAFRPASCPVQRTHYVDPTNASYDYNETQGDCGILADALIYVDGYVRDLTNGSYYPVNFTTIGSCYSNYNNPYCYDEWGNTTDNSTSINWFAYGPNSAYCATTAPCTAGLNTSYGTAWNSSVSTINLSGYESIVSNAPSQGHAGWHFDRHHHYAVYYQVQLFVDTDVYEYRVGVAKASLDATAAHGFGWQVTSLTVR